jgi:predicted TIM-barrel fold metal-dependent hydrolase
MAAGLASPDESVVICSAYNEYFLEKWCEADSRYRYAICVSPQDPEQSAAEIHRLASHRGVAAVYMPTVNTLLGHRFHFPIYAAAQEHDLPIFQHVSGAEGAFQGSPAAIGFPETFAERRATYPLYAMTGLSSLVFSGVFTKFPRLKFAFLEYGFSWLLTFLWRMDKLWQEARVDVPWVTEAPSEMLRERVKFGTQPIDEPAAEGQLMELIAMMGAGWLMFSTDYPHWDGDEPAMVLKGLSPQDQQRVFRTNAESIFRLGA